MKALTITHPGLRKERLLQRQRKYLRMDWDSAGLILLSSGWKSSQVAELFGLTRWSVDMINILID